MVHGGLEHWDDRNRLSPTFRLETTIQEMGEVDLHGYSFMDIHFGIVGI